MNNAYLKKIESLSVASRPQAPWMFVARLQLFLNPLLRDRARSFAFRFLIAIAPDFVPIGSSDRMSKLWRVVIEVKKELLKAEKILIWGEVWTWKKGDFAPSSSLPKLAKTPRKMFTF
ncbi:hypothetical protein [Roseofilum casamattae]|uniref:Uncharacterized protein n=1 Tax=Roseofilum casamattae BLCC-M143 TaxID=3022442 RepID=A0ABT7C364_9CYAN|nr:hypothetical protein [Roseofilum casamattae]MDJ1185894.1 hypothetical protein [Roseofilum casamattae BLCC-M143]